ncbi:MAG: HipA N-terminal domain-containing protein [Candidatus Marinimicrobia bacterium]|nr:HipA N-terminal domain-containing protein [Candidatus Neomarinimicrobiota bacterium]
MRKAKVYIDGISAGYLQELERSRSYKFEYDEDYEGPPVSLTMPLAQRSYSFDRFPPFFDGLLPEGVMLEGLLRLRKIDQYDYFSQLLAVGQDLVGAATVEEVE